MPLLRLHYSKYSLPLLQFFQKKQKNIFADIKTIYIFALSIKTKPTGRFAGTKKIEL